MRAVGFRKVGTIDRKDALLDLNVPNPIAGPRDLLVRVRAVSVNPVDTKLRSSGKPRSDKPVILGFDAAGTVETIGAEVTLFAPGDKVFYAGTIKRPGTNAELHVVDERLVGRKPRSINWAGAAALPLTALTAWELLFEGLHASAGDKGSLLVINGAGGVGSILIQLARQLTGMTVIATASRAESKAWVERMGAHHVIDHHKPLAEALVAIGFPTVERVASLADSERHLPTFPKIIAPRGRLALIDEVHSFDIVGLRQKSITVAWEGVFTRSTYQTVDMIRQHEILTEVSRLVDEGVLQTTLRHVVGTLDAAHLKVAHRILESGGAIGKVVLESVPPDS